MGRIVFSLCPFPDESTGMYQIWCQSVQQFDSFPRLLNLWPPIPPCPWCIKRRLGFIFPDESTYVNQSWCQSVQPFDSFPWLLNVWPPKPHKCPLVSLGAICLEYIHSQMNLHMCTKCGANRISRLTSSPDFWICDLLTPQMSRGELYLAYVHSQTNPQTSTKCGANLSSRLTASQTFGFVTP